MACDNVSQEIRKANVLAHGQHSSGSQYRRQTSPKALQLSLQGICNNSCVSSGLLIVGEDVKLAISKQKLKIMLLALNTKLAFIPIGEVWP